MLRWIQTNAKSALIACSLLIATQAQAEKILMIGDSLTCGPFGKNVMKHLSATHDVVLYCAVSSTPTNWFFGTNPKRGGGRTWPCQTMTSSLQVLKNCDGTGKVPKFTDLLKQNPKARVIVALGTNSAASPKPDSTYKSLVDLIEANDQKCTWIGPPHFDVSKNAVLKTFAGNLGPFYVALAKVVGQTCKLVDSRPATAAGTPGFATNDGIHRTEAGGKYWADQIKDKIL